MNTESKQQELFKDWQFICLRLKDEAVIIQNSGIKISSGETEDWEARVIGLIADIQQMKDEIREFLESCQ